MRSYGAVNLQKTQNRGSWKTRFFRFLAAHRFLGNGAPDLSSERK
jgi:hypothetical protein